MTLFPLRSAADTSGEVQRLLGKFEARDNAPDIVRIMANSEQAFLLWVHGIDALMHRSSLPALDREVAILRLAALLDVPYQWEQHDRIARDLGMSVSTIAALRSTDRPFPSDEVPAAHSLVVACVDGVVEGDGLSDELWGDCVAQWGHEAAFDLMTAIAWWGGFVPRLIDIARLTGQWTTTHP